MGKKKDLSRDPRGLFVRNLGWRWNGTKYVHQKFYLGRDETTAKIACLKLEQLWEAVCRRWEAGTLPKARAKHSDHSQLVEQPGESHGMALVTVGVPELEYVREGKPVWDEVSLTIADAIRAAAPIVRIPIPEQLAPFGLESPSVGHWLHQLRRDLPFIHIELRDLARQEEAEAQIYEEGTRLIKTGRRMTRRQGGDETLHEALTAYAEALKKKHVNLDGTASPTGTSQARQVQFLLDHLPDCRLADIDTARVLLCQDTLALRPEGKKRKKQITARSARNYIKIFRHFIRWLSMESSFDWKRPADLEFTAIRIPQTVAERSKLAHTARVQTYTVDEIKVLWEYATPLRRLLLLLGLNCGFDAKMVATLQPDDILLRQKHPHERELLFTSSEQDSWIFRMRNKTSVYGEFKLWPITVTALDWWSRQREQIQIAEGVTSFLVNQKGRSYDTPTPKNDRNVQIPNMWRGLTAAIRKDNKHTDFRILSFGKLRKTAGNLIRAEGGGEAAGIFLCHGTPVKSDDLLDVYTNRHFPKVFEAIDLVNQRLSNIWSSVDNPFPEVRSKGSNNISIGKIRRIQSLRKQGFKVAHIAKEVGVSTQTVSRHSGKKRK